MSETEGGLTLTGRHKKMREMTEVFQLAVYFPNVCKQPELGWVKLSSNVGGRNPNTATITCYFLRRTLAGSGMVCGIANSNQTFLCGMWVS